MEQEQISELSTMLHVSEEEVNNFVTSIPVGALADVVNNLKNGYSEPIEKMYNNYMEQSVTENVQKDVQTTYNRYREDGKSHYDALAFTAMDYGLDTPEEVLSYLKSKNESYTNEFDSEIQKVLEGIEQIRISEKCLGGTLLDGIDLGKLSLIGKATRKKVKKIINKVANMTESEIMQAHANLRGFEHVGLAEQETSMSTLTSVVLENKLLELFEAMKNKWLKRNLLVKTKKDGIGTDGLPEFDLSDVLNPDQEVKFQFDESAKDFKKYIIKHSKNN